MGRQVRNPFEILLDRTMPCNYLFHSISRDVNLPCQKILITKSFHLNIFCLNWKKPPYKSVCFSGLQKVIWQTIFASAASCCTIYTSKVGWILIKSSFFTLAWIECPGYTFLKFHHQIFPQSTLFFPNKFSFHSSFLWFSFIQVNLQF